MIKSRLDNGTLWESPSSTEAYRIMSVIERSPNVAYWGLRSLSEDEDYSIGDIPRDSYDWDEENDCSSYYTDGTTLGGVCTIGITDPESMASVYVALNLAKGYDTGNGMVLIGADSFREGDDYREWILPDSKIYDII